MIDVDKITVTTDAFRDTVDEPRVVQNWQRIEVRRRRKRTVRLRNRAIFAVTVLLAVVGIGALIHRLVDIPAAPTPLDFEAFESVRRFDVPFAATVNRRIPLSDGSIMTLAPGASLVVLKNEPDRFITSLFNGWARYNVVPGHGRTWEVDLSLCRVVVLGTQFTVSRTSSAVRVAVHRGTVQVVPTGQDGVVKKLHAGETYSLRFPEQEDSRRAPPPSRIAEDGPDHSGMARPSRSSGVDARRPRPDSTKIAGPGAGESVKRLLQKANEARDRNQPQQAVTLLERILREYPRDPSQGLVTLTLAQIRLDTLHQPRAAAVLFQQAAVSAGLPSSLREQAYARSVEAFHRAGDAPSAGKMGEQYKRRFPDGSWLPYIERWTESE